MNSTTKILLSLSLVIGLVLGSPLELNSYETDIVPSADGDTNYRLTEEVLPVSYDIELTPFFEDEGAGAIKKAFTFDGVVKIIMRTTLTTLRNVTLHANNLNIIKYSFTPASLGGKVFESAQYDNVTDKWTIPLDIPMAENTDVLLTVEYSGVMGDDMHGLYRSYYYQNGAKVWMASTQLQQTEARRVFPCFDEPGFKANFRLVVNRPSTIGSTLSNTALANAPTNVTAVAPLTIPRKKDEFKWTPVMSTYLLAIIISNYDGSQNADKSFGVFARPQSKNTTDYALKFGQDMLKQFGVYLGIDYYTMNNITKMDMAGIPDFSAGAMENWGLLTYREASILYDEETTPAISQQRIAAVIAHEQAHMWFGDMLTCKWWSETWLNEGFARYFQFFGTHMINPSWNMDYQFVVENLQQSMQLDSTDNTHPMSHDSVNTKSEASAMFDNISYNKAGSIIRMLSHMIGAAKFQETLKSYLTTYMYKAVTSDNLFTALELVNPGAAEMTKHWATWVKTPGFPLITAKLNGNILTVSQKRFMQATGITHSKAELYNVPITVAVDSKDYTTTTPAFIYRIEDTGEKSFNLTAAPEKYYILNVQQTGFYRVNYEEDNWNKISEALHKDEHDKIHVLNRAQIVDDLLNLARAGVVKYSAAVDIVRYIKKEQNYIPWLSAFNGLTFLSQRVSSGNKEVFQWFILDLVEDIYKHLTFVAKPSEARTDIYNRNNILSWACKFGHEECKKLSLENFENYRLNGTKVHKDLRSVVYCNAIRQGNSTHYDFLNDKFMKENIAAEQLNIMSGLSCTKEATLVKKYLDRVLTEDIRPQDKSSAITNFLNANPENVDLLFTYIKDNLVKWKQVIGGVGQLSTIAGRFTTKEQVTAFETFINAQKTELGTSYDSLAKAVTTANTNLEWDGKYFKEFIDHLNEIKNSAPIKSISLIITAFTFAVLYFFN